MIPLVSKVTERPAVFKIFWKSTWENNLDKGHGLYICWNSNTFLSLTDSELSLTSLDPDILSELGGHAHQESLTLSSDSFMEVVTTATNNLKLHR